MLKSVGEPLFQADIKGLVPVLNGFAREDEKVYNEKDYEKYSQTLYNEVAEHRCENYCCYKSEYTLYRKALIQLDIRPRFLRYKTH